MIYLDNAATTRPCGAAVQAITRTLTQDWGNPSAVHRFGITAARLLQQSRKSVAQALGAQPDRVFFTSCGTEADNWAIFPRPNAWPNAANTSSPPPSSITRS